MGKNEDVSGQPPSRRIALWRAGEVRSQPLHKAKNPIPYQKEWGSAFMIYVSRLYKASFLHFSPKPSWPSAKRA
ncbi:MAG: hypothetical protein CVU64_01785 [Deltaproteobacteria bacterium HGW-Deltaproteobacteria-21]|nr:MAG: hypothetical protein CVU64_01785 [Deltaproteobacteria bacterium HGW-Deltaproteobacteria-21]